LGKFKESCKRTFLIDTCDKVLGEFSNIVSVDRVEEFQAIVNLYSPIGKLDSFADRMLEEFRKYKPNL